MSGKKLRCTGCGTDLSGLVSRSTRRVECPGCRRQYTVSCRDPGAALWYFAREDQRVRGPFTVDQLQGLARRGELCPTDLLWQQGTRLWQVAGDCPGLFRPAAAETPPTLAAAKDSDAPAMAPPPLPGPLSQKGIHVRPPRSVSLGELQILKKLGAGAMGAVYLARQRSQERPVALKVLARHLALRRGFIERFYREAAVMARLEHPNIVKLHGVGEAAGLHYLVMEYVDGFNMATLAQRRGGTLPVGDAVHLGLTCARALAYAQMRRVVHRDIKPTNIMVNQLGHIKLADLGLAKSLDEEEIPSLTDTGVGAGTPEYVAPEQAVNARDADHRADIYALGGVLYHLLTGHLPFEDTNSARLLRAKEAGIFPPARRLNPYIPPRLELILEQMLARDLKSRYQTWEEVIAHLESLHVAGANFSFNPLHIAPEAVAPVPAPMEILLVDDSTENILLAQDVLEEQRACTNLNVVRDNAEARAFLTRAEGYAWAPRPDIIILGQGVAAGDGPALVASLRADDRLSAITIVILAAAGQGPRVLQGHAADFEVSLKVAGTFGQLREFFEAQEPGSTVAVMELPRP